MVKCRNCGVELGSGDNCVFATFRVEMGGREITMCCARCAAAMSAEQGVGPAPAPAPMAPLAEEQASVTEAAAGPVKTDKGKVASRPKKAKTPKKVKKPKKPKKVLKAGNARKPKKARSLGKKASHRRRPHKRRR